MSLLALAGLLISLYLAATRLAGGVPACGPIRGCETVSTSPYSEIFGIPVALLGVGFSLLLLGATLRWWRLVDELALRAAYALGLIGVIFVAYLTYLEVFVIEAICVWCVAYASTVLAGFVVAAAALRSGRAPDAGPPRPS
jgi:uncharacterized membrane protein